MSKNSNLSVYDFTPALTIFERSKTSVPDNNSMNINQWRKKTNLLNDDLF